MYYVHNAISIVDIAKRFSASLMSVLSGAQSRTEIQQEILFEIAHQILLNNLFG